MDPLFEEAILLLSEDLRDARERLCLTSARAAKRAGISTSQYRMLESELHKTQDDLNEMISVARRLGLESVRVFYADFIEQYVRVGFAENGPSMFFIDTLDLSAAQLREKGYFISPHQLLDFVDREGIGPILDSKDRVDKMIVELWTTAIFTLSMDGDLEYYVRAVGVDPPDTEVLMVDKKTKDLSSMRIEITRYGKYSATVTDIIGKKLMKSYQDGTVLLILVEKALNHSISDLYDFIQKNNPRGQSIVLIGSTEEDGRFKVVPWDKVPAPTPGEEAYMQVIVDTYDRSKGSCKYNGVMYKPPYMSRFPRALPVFIRTVDLHR